MRVLIVLTKVNQIFEHSFLEAAAADGVSLTVSAPDKAAAEVIEKKIVEDLKKRING